MAGAGKAIKVGLQGYGLSGRIFQRQLAQEAGMEVAAVVTRNENRRAQVKAELPGARIYDTYAELLADSSIELVVLGTPHDQHAPEAIAAAHAGKHCVVDKIMCLSAAEADRMVAAAKANGVLLSVFHNRRWDGDYLTVQKAIADGLLGEIYSVECAVVGFGEPPVDPANVAWRARAEKGGGPLRDWGAHLMDQAVQLYGAEPEILLADLQYLWPGITVEQAATVVFRYPSGVRYRIEVGSISLIRRPHWYVRGSKGSLLIEGIDPQEGFLKQGRVVGGTEEAQLPAANFRFESRVPGAQLEIVPGDYRQYYRNVRDAIRGEAELAVSGEQVRSVMALYDRIFAAAQHAPWAKPVFGGRD
ncbi:MAG TPA: Gfo/Idh/MocA family oxidoreductase [Limnochordia bacterium]|nr:Gfo/Idh/MocA family oxidoreductase [Limnochordia bacterium]